MNKLKSLQNEKRDAEIDIKDIYTPLSVAKKEVWRRWNDKKLRKKVEKYLGVKVPAPFEKLPRAVLSRNIITPNFEFYHFLDLVKKIKIKPVGLEGVSDKFCTKNVDKVYYGKLTFYKNKKNINEKSERNIIRIINIPAVDGKRFCDIQTLWGEDLVGFHHKLLRNNNINIETFDDFKWFDENKKRNNAKQYYENFLTLFLCHGVLFENFHADGKEKKFTSEVILKSLKKIEKIFNIKPLIVPLVPIKQEKRLSYWNAYLGDFGKK